MNRPFQRPFLLLMAITPNSAFSGRIVTLLGMFFPITAFINRFLAQLGKDSFARAGKRVLIFTVTVSTWKYRCRLIRKRLSALQLYVRTRGPVLYVGYSLPFWENTKNSPLCSSLLPLFSGFHLLLWGISNAINP